MEFTNEIYFSNPLTENKKAKIKYAGRLFKRGSDSVTIVYGFGENWDYTEEREMVKHDDGFEIELEIRAYQTFNFCFRNQNYEWDNNNSFNYISPIEKEVTEANTNTQTELHNLENEISLLFDELFNETQKENNIQTINVEETTSNNTQKFNLDELIEEILNPIVADSSSLIEAIAPEIEEEVLEEATENEVFEFPTHIQKTSTLVEDILVPFAAEEKSQETNNVDALLETLAQNTAAANVNLAEKEEKIENIETTEINNIENIETVKTEETLEVAQAEVTEKEVENIEVAEIKEEVKPAKKISDFTILEDEEVIEEPSLLEELTTEKETEKIEKNVALSVIEQTDNFLVSPRKLNKFYFFKKKVKLAFYKAFVAIPKFFAKQFNSDNNN